MSVERVVRVVLPVFVAVFACRGTRAEPIAYTNETAFLSAVEAQGYVYIVESFEDDETWGDVRSTIPGGSHARDSVTHFGVRFSANSSESGITTSQGPPRTGLWGAYALPHGSFATGVDCDVPGNCGDGLLAASGQPMHACSAWVTGTYGGKVAVILDGDRANPVDFPEVCDASGENCVNYGLLTAQHKFFGVIEPEGFAQFELREMEGKAEDQKLIWCDDFIVAFSRPPSPRISSTVPTAGGVDLHFKELAILAHYTLERASTLMPGDWAASDTFTASSTQADRLGAADGSWGQAFFRLRSP